MVLTPLYQLVGDIKCFSIASIQVTDAINNESDSVVIECEKFISKKEDPKIELYLGYTNSALWKVGVYSLQSVTYMPKKVKLLFTSVEFDKTFKEKRTVSFQKLTIKELVSKIAAKHNLKSKCDMEQFLEHIDQKNESDLALLNRIANKYNAIFNIKNKTLIFLSKTSKKLPVFEINANQANTWNIYTNNRFLYRSIEAKYHSIKENKTNIIKIGSKKPTYILEDIYKNKTEALNIAKAKLDQLIAKSAGGNIVLEGQNIIAGAKVNIKGFSNYIDGLYLINNVEHSISSVFTSSITVEKVSS